MRTSITWANSYLRSGVTALELLVAMGILLVVASIITSGFLASRRSAALVSAAEDGLNLLTRARVETLGSRGGLAYGVHFESARMVFFQGGTFVDGTATNEVMTLSDEVEISTISLAGGGSDVIFQRLTGATAQYGTVMFRLKRNTSQTRTITIRATGVLGL